MVLEKRWLFSIGNGGAEIQRLSMGRKSPEESIGLNSLLRGNGTLTSTACSKLRTLRLIWLHIIPASILGSIISMADIASNKPNLKNSHSITLPGVSLNIGSYRSAHVLLHLINELRKRDKMRGLPSILSLFRNKFNKFNNTGARMLDSIYHMAFKLF